MIGNRIKQRRTQLSLTQEELANELDISRNTIINWEKGRRNPDSEALPKVANSLNTSVAFLIGETDDPTAPSFRLGKRDELQKERSDSIDLSQIKHPEFIRVPVFDADTCAGGGWSHEYMDVELQEYTILPRDEVGPISAYPDKQPFVVQIKGDSMEEADLTDGMKVCINPAAEVHDGNPAMVRYGDDRTIAIKWVYFHSNGDIELRSASLLYPQRVFTKKQLENGFHFDIIGKVTMFFGRPKDGV